MIDGCKNCKYEDTPCIIRICGNAPRATADDIKTFEKCVMLNKMKSKEKGRQRGVQNGKNDSGAIPRINK